MAIGLLFSVFAFFIMILSSIAISGESGAIQAFHWARLEYYDSKTKTSFTVYSGLTALYSKACIQGECISRNKAWDDACDNAIDSYC
jgi:hypothetical protein